MSYQFVTQEELDQQKKYTIDQFIRDVEESKRVGMSLVDLDGGHSVPFKQCNEPGCTKLSAMDSKCPDHVPMTVDQRETLESMANVKQIFGRTLTGYDVQCIKKALQLIDKLDAELAQHRVLHKLSTEKIHELSDCVVGLLRAIKTFDDSVSAIAPDREFILNDKRRVER
jgi:hypothetical protein